MSLTHCPACNARLPDMPGDVLTCSRCQRLVVVVEDAPAEAATAGRLRAFPVMVFFLTLITGAILAWLGSMAASNPYAAPFLYPQMIGVAVIAFIIGLLLWYFGHKPG